MTRDRPPWWVVGWCVFLAAVVLGPGLGPGFVLSYDMVAVPDQRLVPSAWGGGSALPRAVPQDTLVAVLDSVLPGELLQKLVLLAILTFAGIGVAVLLARSGMGAGAQMVSATVFVWNPYVAERLVLGHWGLLACYGALPWLISAARRLRAGEGGPASAALVLAVAASSITPTGGVLAVGAVLILVAVPGGRLSRRHRAAAAGAAVALQLPWLVPSAFHVGAATSDPAGVGAFSARADGPLGLLGSLATLGGIWNAEAVPTSRALWSSALLSLAILALAALGVGRLARVLGRGATITLSAIAIAGLIIAAAGAVGPTADVVAWVVAEVPGGGLIRDGHKFLAPYALVLAITAGLGASRLAGRFRGRYASRLVVVVAIFLPIAAMPDLAWGVSGRVAAWSYPAAWSQVRSALDAVDAPGDVVVVPFQPFRSFPWTNHRVVLDPAPRFLGRETVLPGDLTVADQLVKGEDVRAAEVGTALREDDVRRLGDLGVGWVVVERDTPGRIPDGVLAQLEPLVISGVLDVYRVPGPVTPWPVAGHVGAAIAGWVAALSVVATAAGWVVGPRIWRLRRAAGRRAERVDQPA